MKRFALLRLARWLSARCRAKDIARRAFLSFLAWTGALCLSLAPAGAWPCSSRGLVPWHLVGALLSLGTLAPWHLGLGALQAWHWAWEWYAGGW